LKEKQICQLLGKIPKYSGVIDMPSAAQLETIKHRVIGLKNIQVIFILYYLLLFF